MSSTEHDELFAEVIEVDGRKFLFWLEPGVVEWTLHQIAAVRGVGTADVSLNFTPAEGRTEAEIWAHFAKNNFAKCRATVLEAVQAVEVL